MTDIIRNPKTAANQSYDLIIIGGGIYGAMVSLLSSLSGLRALLLERDDFGGATSYNSLRILHGGLRYLQTLDLPRFFESVGERHWFLKTFPELTEAMPCLMPLYGEGARRPPVLKAALTLNDGLSATRNRGVRRDRTLPNGNVVSAQAVQQHFAHVDTDGLQGGAIWYDGSMPDSQRILINVLRWAGRAGATALNYVEAQQLQLDHNQVTGVVAQDRISGESYCYQAHRVVNAAGPWCRELAAQFDRDVPDLFHSSIAWNALVDRPALSDYALAIAPKQPQARTYFIRPWKGRMLVGTVHDPWLQAVQKNPMPTAEQLEDCIADLNTAIPDLKLSQREILRIFSGLLPAKESGTAELAKRPVLWHHAAQNGPAGVFSISGVKFTTARLEAEKTLAAVFPNRASTIKAAKRQAAPADLNQRDGLFAYDWMPHAVQDDDAADADWLEDLQRIIHDEAVMHLDDLILRRTSLGDNRDRALALAPSLCRLFPWDEARCKAEIARVHDYFAAVNPNSATAVASLP